MARLDSSLYCILNPRQSRSVRSNTTANNGLFHFYVDHLGSATVLNKGGTKVTGSETYYAPFGGYRNTSTTNLAISDRGYTGHLENMEIGLVYMRARFYVPSIGRFASADTIVPEPADPQSFNRYSYVRNQPLVLTDPSGHMDTDGCETEGCSIPNGFNANSTWVKPDGTLVPWDPVLADAQDYDPLTEAVLPAAAGIAGVAAAPTVAGYLAWPTLSRIGSTIASWLCLRDGDCTNEVQSVWRLNPWQRGVAIENRLGRSPSLAQNFPVIDRFDKGVATSIKSLDLGAKSYQNIGTLTRTVEGYVNTLANWQGARWGGVTIDASMITHREVLLAVPPGANSAQQQALHQLQQWASSLNVSLTTVTIP